MVDIPNNWRPRIDQMKLWGYLENGGLRAVQVAHRRWGKDDVALHFTATSMIKRIGNYWHMLPEYNQARKAIWEAVNPRTGLRRIDEAFPEELRSSTRNQDMMIKFVNGSTWQLVGSDNFNALVGSPPVGIVNSEYALADPQAWAFLAPILEENGGWSIFIYTPRGKNHGFKLVRFAETEPGWHAETLTAKQTPVFSDEQLDRILRERKGLFGEVEGLMLFMQEYMCSFEGYVRGAYYSKQILDAKEAGRVCSVPYEQGYEVYTFWDLGIDDSTTIWFLQTIGREIRFIDYYSNTGEGLSHYAKVLKKKPYVYGDHHLPHDVKVRSLSTGKSRRDTLISLGIKPIITIKRAKDTESVLAGIESCRNILSRCWFDKVKCQQGLACLEGYQAEYDEKKKKLGNKPLHNWCSHGADAFRTFGVGFKEKVGVGLKIIPGVKKIVSGWSR